MVVIDGEDAYAYWYVLTYLPDLQWCHVAPLEARGTFSSKPAPCGHVAEGRMRWMLVSEEEVCSRAAYCGSGIVSCYLSQS